MATQNIYGLADFQSNYWVQGFTLQSVTNTTMVFSTGSARARNSDWVSEYPGSIPNLPNTLTINAATIGANGCFPLALSTQTPAGGLVVLPIYAVSSSAGTTGGSLNAQVSPALVIATASTGFVPSQYDSYSFAGIALLNSSGNLVNYCVNGYGNLRTIMLQDAQTTLSGGVATTQTKVDLILGASGGNLNFAMLQEVQLRYAFTPNSAVDVAAVVPHGLTPSSILSSAPIIIKASGAAAIDGVFTMPVGNDGGIAAVDYAVTSASDSLTLSISGFTLYLPFIS